MADLQFYINDVLVHPPDNWQSVDIELNFETQSQQASIKSTTYEWLGDNAKVLNDWKDRGLIGGYGLFEGTPFRIEACDGVVVFDGCIDMTSAETTFQCDIVKASVKETNRAENVLELAQGFSFALLGSFGYTGPGLIRPGDFVSVPYVISSIPDWLQVVTLIITFIDLVNIIKTGIQHTIELTTTAAAAYPAVGLIALYGGLAALSTIYVAYIIDLAIHVLKMMFNDLIQPIKFKYGMRVVLLFQRACEYLGLNFSSTFLQGEIYRDLVYIPSKNSYNNNASVTDELLNDILSTDIDRKHYSDTENTYIPFGPGSQYGWYDGTFSQFISDMSDLFNSKVTMVGNVFHFERIDFWDNTASFTVPPISSEAPFDDPFGTNANEIKANYFIEYQTDTQDLNTQDIYDGTSFQMTLTPQVVSVKKNLLLKGLTEKRFNFALAKRKEGLSSVEKVCQKVLDFLNGIGLGGSIDINERVGCMLLSGDTTSIPKLLIVDPDPIYWSEPGVYGNSVSSNNSVPSTHLGFTDANFIARAFHAASFGITTFYTSQPNTAISLNLGPTRYPNQYLTFKSKEMPICCSDFAKIKGNNIITTTDGEFGRIDSMRWNPFEETAVVDFRVRKPYTHNFNQQIIVDGSITYE